MAYVITQPCCNDASCVEVCPVDCIRPTPADPEYITAEMLYIDPDTCIDCGACVDVCPVGAIFPEDDLDVANARYRDINAEYFERRPLLPAVDSPEPMAQFEMAEDAAPMRVAIVGTGPAASYAAAELVSRCGPSVEVEMFDRLPTPWGLARSGVAPDHPDTKDITDIFRWMESHPSVRFHLNVEIGEHLTHDELMAYHHAVVYAVGTSGDRRLGLPGEDLPGCHAATEVVAWYNGHPDYADRQFDLSGERAVILGNGNVALDVARILMTDPDELADTDIAEHALEQLRSSNIREVVVLGRRGPAQAACTSPELIALAHLKGVDVLVDPADVTLDEHSSALVAGPDADPATVLKCEVLHEFSQHTPSPANRRIVLRFLRSPTRVLGTDHVTGLDIVRNELVKDEDGALRVRAACQAEAISTGLVLRSIGYRGTPVLGLPFDEARGTIANQAGRVIDPRTQKLVAGAYTAGWIKRGPSGVIGTNKKCAQETVTHLLEDFAANRLSRPPGDRLDLAALVRERQPDVVDHQGWQAIDKAERERGTASGRPRSKIVDVKSMVEISQACRLSAK